MNQATQRSVFVVEDDPVLAIDLETTLEGAGFTVLGPAITSGEALDLLYAQAPDLTILDINLGSEMVFPVADFLADTGCRFLFLSGHSREWVPARHRNRPFLQKPYAAATLLGTIDALLGAPPAKPASPAALNPIGVERNGPRN